MLNEQECIDRAVRARKNWLEAEAESQRLDRLALRKGMRKGMRWGLVLGLLCWAGIAAAWIALASGRAPSTPRTVRCVPDPEFVRACILTPATRLGRSAEECIYEARVAGFCIRGVVR